MGPKQLGFQRLIKLLLLLSDLLTIETKAEMLRWHHSSRRPTSFLVAITSGPLHLGKGNVFPYQNGHVLHGFAFPACRALEWGRTDWLIHSHGVLINSKRIYPIAADYGSGGMTMVPIGPTTYRTIWKMTTREASWRHTEASAWKLYAVRMGCQSSGYGINFKPMAIICYCVSNRWNAWIWGKKGRM